jgi:indole-3-glycerol phosphate synthase
MINRIDPIIAQKKREVESLYALIKKEPSHHIAKILSGEMRCSTIKNFKHALRNSTLSIIAEIKRRSPSKGPLASIPDPVSLAKKYIEANANAISILTDKLFFEGSLEDLSQVSKACRENAQPVLRKDFIIDEIQIAQAVMAGADAILCIVAVLGQKTPTIVKHAKAMGIQALVEIHDEKELETALTSGAEVIGVNNRDLTTLDVDPRHALTLIDKIPRDIISIAESGILLPALANEYFCAGFDAVLVGEALVKSADPIEFMQRCRYA